LDKSDSLDVGATPRRSTSSLDAMRPLVLVAVFLSTAPLESISCTCDGTRSIGSALTDADAIIVGKVTRHVAPDYSPDRPRPAIVDVEVMDSLKGQVRGSVEIAEAQMCYQSFPDRTLEIGKSYVFPLTTVDLADSPDTWSHIIGLKVLSYKVFRLPVCSHNALLLDGQQLFTNELTFNGGRRLQYYMPLSLMKVLLPSGFLVVARTLILVLGAAAAGAAIVVIRKRWRETRQRV
jgi:hypothetical protein